MFTSVLVLMAMPPGSDVKPVSQFAKLDDLRIHYQSRGAGPATIVFVHGWTCDLTFWQAQETAFASQARVLLIDLPGHGKSDKPRIDYTMDLFAKSIDAVLKDARVESAVLVGHSMGAPVVRQFYRHFPRKTQALVLVDGSLVSFLKKDDLERAVERLSGPDYEKRMGESIERLFVAQTPEELRKRIRAVMLATPSQVATSALRGLCDPAIGKDDPIEVPVQTIAVKSRKWPDGYKDYLDKIAPKRDERVMEGVGHFLMMEKPQEFNALMAGFLQTHGFIKGR
jgi:pimeloyl-ACP methyl ester carboxylesterase